MHESILRVLSRAIRHIRLIKPDVFFMEFLWNSETATSVLLRASDRIRYQQNVSTRYFSVQNERIKKPIHIRRRTRGRRIRNSKIRHSVTYFWPF